VLELISCEKITANFSGKSIRELDIRNESGTNIIGMKRKDESFLINPNPDAHLNPSDRLFVLGTRNQINHLIELITEGQGEKI
jgi:voltage-gated potassium channel